MEVTLKQARQAGFKVDYPENPRGIGMPYFDGPYGRRVAGYREAPERIELDPRCPRHCIWLVYPDRRIPVFLTTREGAQAMAQAFDEGKVRYIPSEREPLGLYIQVTL